MKISVCSLKREVKVKVTKFCIGREEPIKVNKLTKFDLCIINGLWETKLNPNCWCRTDRQTDGFCQFIDRTCFAIWSKTCLQLLTLYYCQRNDKSSHPCYMCYIFFQICPIWCNLVSQNILFCLNPLLSIVCSSCKRKVITCFVVLAALAVYQIHQS